MQTFTHGAYRAKLTPTRNVGEFAAKLAKCNGKSRRLPLRDTRTKSEFPRFRPGMSTADYVRAFESGHLCAWQWEQLNEEPCALYSGEDTCETLPDGFDTWEDFDAAQSADAAPESTQAAANDDAAPNVPDPEPAAHGEDVAAPVPDLEAISAWYAAVNGAVRRGLDRTPIQNLPNYARMAIERADADSGLRSTAKVSELVRAYAATYGAIAEEWEIASALYICGRRFWDFDAAPDGAPVAAPVDPLPTQSDSVPVPGKSEPDPVPGESEPLADRIMATIGAREPGSILTAKGYAQALEVSEIDAARECEKLAVSGKLVRFDYSAQGFPPGFALPYLAPGGDPVPPDTQPETAPASPPATHSEPEKALPYAGFDPVRGAVYRAHIETAKHSRAIDPTFSGMLRRPRSAGFMVDFMAPEVRAHRNAIAAIVRACRAKRASVPLPADTGPLTTDTGADLGEQSAHRIGRESFERGEAMMSDASLRRTFGSQAERDAYYRGYDDAERAARPAPATHSDPVPSADPLPADSQDAPDVAKWRAELRSVEDAILRAAPARYSNGRHGCDIEAAARSRSVAADLKRQRKYLRASLRGARMMADAVQPAPVASAPPPVESRPLTPAAERTFATDEADERASVRPWPDPLPAEPAPVPGKSEPAADPFDAWHAAPNDPKPTFGAYSYAKRTGRTVIAYCGDGRIQSCAKAAGMRYVHRVQGFVGTPKQAEKMRAAWLAGAMHNAERAKASAATPGSLRAMLESLAVPTHTPLPGDTKPEALEDDETIPAPLDGLDVVELGDDGMAEFEQAAREQATAPAYRELTTAHYRPQGPCLRIPAFDARAMIPQRFAPVYLLRA